VRAADIAYAQHSGRILLPLRERGAYELLLDGHAGIRPKRGNFVFHNSRARHADIINVVV